MPKSKQTVESILTKPKVFIGSSTKGLWAANKLRRCLSRTAVCTVWTQGVFGLGVGTLEALVKATRKYDFAILVLTPDDLATKKGVRMNIPRDNVIFELGLFMGALSKERTFIVLRKGIALPSDLDGITRTFFSGKDLKKACEDIKRAMRGAPEQTRNLTGQWYSSYQRHDPPIGQWIEDMTRVRTKSPGKLSFENHNNPVESTYKALGEFTGNNEIVGVWQETVGEATASGTFHLYMAPFGRKLYGICTGPGVSNEHIYSGWVLVRDDPAKLKEARQELTRAMLVCRPLRVARPLRSQIGADKPQQGRRTMSGLSKPGRD